VFGPWFYVFGTRSTGADFGRELYVGRAAVADPADRSRWEFWDGQDWQADLERYTNLRRGGLVSQADYDARVATAGALDAAIAADNAAVENAKLQLQYTHIKAAVSGRTGALLVHVGALVRSADATPLVVINQVVPAYVSFTLPASLLDRIHAQQAKAPLQTNASAPGSAAPSPGTRRFLNMMSAALTLLLAATVWALMTPGEPPVSRVLIAAFMVLALLAFPFVMVAYGSRREAEEANLRRAIRKAIVDDERLARR